jgi:hypothetical protein
MTSAACPYTSFRWIWAGAATGPQEDPCRTGRRGPTEADLAWCRLNPLSARPNALPESPSLPSIQNTRCLVPRNGVPKVRPTISFRPICRANLRDGRLSPCRASLRGETDDQDPAEQVCKAGRSTEFPPSGPERSPSPMLLTHVGYDMMHHP